MKRGLKDRGGGGEKRLKRISGYNPLPDEKGTERRLNDLLIHDVYALLCYNPLPDEKGTESVRAMTLNTDLEVREVTILYPMKRGLKAEMNLIIRRLLLPSLQSFTRLKGD